MTLMTLMPFINCLYLLKLVFYQLYELRQSDLILGTLEVRLMGCQDILEIVPGRSKATSFTLPGWSPSEARSSFMSRTSKSKSGSCRNLLKTDDLSSSVPFLMVFFSSFSETLLRNLLGKVNYM